jgi:hypothetical protein
MTTNPTPEPRPADEMLRELLHLFKTVDAAVRDFGEAHCGAGGANWSPCGGCAWCDSGESEMIDHDLFGLRWILGKVALGIESSILNPRGLDAADAAPAAESADDDAPGELPMARMPVLILPFQKKGQTR